MCGSVLAPNFFGLVSILAYGFGWHPNALRSHPSACDSCRFRQGATGSRTRSANQEQDLMLLVEHRTGEDGSKAALDRLHF